MADSAVAVTAGSGTNIDTRTEATNGNHRQVVVIGDPSTNAGVAPVDATTGLAVNITNASLTVASHAVTLAAGASAIAKAEDVASADADVGVPAMAVRKASPANTSGTDGDYEMLQMSAGRLWVDASGKTLTVDHGKTIKTASGSLTSDTDIIAAVTSKRIKVIAYSVISTGTGANAAIFKSNGTGGTEVWRVILQAPAASSVFGANLSIAAPSFLFATVAGEKLTLDVGNSDTIHYSITYFDDDAT